MNVKSIVLTIIIILAVALIAFAVYTFFFQTSDPSGDGIMNRDGGSFLPFGIFGSDDGQTGVVFNDPNETNNTTDQETPAPVSDLRQLVLRPVAGVFLYEDDLGSDVVRYVERGTGHIFDIYPSSGNKVRVSNTTLPQVQEVVWADENNLFLRYLAGDGESIETYAAEVVLPSSSGTSTETGSLLGGFMERDIVSLVTNKSGSASFYITKNPSGSVGTLADGSGENGGATFSSPLSEWLLSWPGQTTVVATTKPSHGVDGHAFTLESSSGSLGWILGGISGLTVLPNNSLTTLLFSSGVDLASFDIDSGIKTDLSLSTLPEKCTWSEDGVTAYCGGPESAPSGDFPDTWYQGLYLFSDSLWRINVSDQTEERLFMSGDFGVDVDVVNPILDSDEEILVFTDKGSLTVWVLFIQEPEAVGEEIPSVEEPFVEE